MLNVISRNKLQCDYFGDGCCFMHAWWV